MNDAENSEIEKRANEDERDTKFTRSRRHLQVSSVTYPERKEVDWQRKVHSSPSKRYRRFSGQEFNNTNEVCVAKRYQRAD